MFRKETHIHGRLYFVTVVLVF